MPGLCRCREAPAGRLLHTALFLISLSGCTGAAFKFGGETRSCLIMQPEGAKGPAPVVFFLNASNSSAQRVKNRFAFHLTGQEGGFVTIYPGGMGNQWNDARQAPFQPGICGH